MPPPPFNHFMFSPSQSAIINFRGATVTIRFLRRYLYFQVACVWLLAGAISSSITVLGAQDARNIMPDAETCAINNRAFSLFGSVAAFYAPMLLMVGSYAATLHLLRRKARFGAAARATHLIHHAPGPHHLQHAPATAPADGWSIRIRTPHLPQSQIR